jgi:ATP phosphoribosyltransferase
LKVRFAIPKGSLEKATIGLLEQAYYDITIDERSYRPTLGDPDIEVKMLRPQEIPVFVAEGVQDAGITGEDWIRESGVDVETLLDLQYGGVKLVVAAPKNIPSKNFSELCQLIWASGKNLRISTEYLNISSEYIASNPVYKRYFGKKMPLIITPWWKRGTNSKARIYLSFGSTEAKPPEDADAIIDVTQTGRSLEQNNLQVLDTVMHSSAVLIANRRSLADSNKKEKLYDILTLLKGVVDAQQRLHIFVNVNQKNLKKLIKELPALKRPTISPLAEEGWFSINTIVERRQFLKLLPKLRKLAQGLVVHYPRQILPLEDIAKNEKGY